MATKKKNSKRSTKSKKTSRKKAMPVKTTKPVKKSTRKKPAPKKAKKKKILSKKQARSKSGRPSTQAFSFKGPGSRSGDQSGDLQGLSRPEAADSESVDELLEEGNAFEAAAVIGVEDADAADGKEVRTREVPEDDVPGEYLDKD
jgi:hypothetical protein